MTPDDAKKRLQQLKAEAMMRAEKEKQYKAATANQYTKDMPSMKEFKAKQRKTGLEKFLEHSHAKERLYHGTGSDIKEFDKQKIKRPYFGHGFHLAESPSLASFYADQFKEGQNVMPVYAQIKNPFVLKSMTDWYDVPGNTDAERTDWIKNKGYDGIKYPHGAPYNAPHESGMGWVAFEPHQIKSAIGNRGTYDPNDPDITKADGGSIHMAGGGPAKKHNFVKHKHGEKVGGYDVGDKINNFGSYASSGIDDVEQGIHRVPMSAFEVTHPNKLFYAKNDIDHVHRLAEQIKQNKYMDPLLVAMDKKGAYVLEGGHRLGAAHLLGMKEIPAIIGHEPDDYATGGSVKPKKTVKAYKMFRVDPKQPGKLFPLFVDANTPVPMNKWVDAKEGEMANGKVKSKIGPLAYRPGWHAGDLPVATHIGDKDEEQKAEIARIKALRDSMLEDIGNDKEGKKIVNKMYPFPSWVNAPRLRNPRHIWAEIDMPHDVDWQSEATKRGYNDEGKFIANQAHITDQMPKGGHYRYKTNSNMTGNWLIGGGMKVNRILHDNEVKAINDAAGAADLPRVKPMKKEAFGFADGGTVAPEEWMAEEHVNHTQKKPTKLVGGGQPPSLDVMKLALTQHGMYSPLEKAMSSLKRPKGTAAEFMTEASKQPGFRKDEVVDRKIQLPDQKLTKAEMLQQLQKSPLPKITEHTLHDFGDEDDALNMASQALYGQNFDEVLDEPRAISKVEDWIKKNQAKYQDYQMPGGKNYREVLLQTPHFSEMDQHRLMELEADRRRSPQPKFWGMDTGANRELAELEKRKASMGEQYHTNHFEGHPNIIAHMRMSDRTGPNGEKLLHVEEIQSDWHQEGRKKGYNKKDPLADEYQALEKKIFGGDSNYTPAEEKRFYDLQEQGYDNKPSSGVPDAPFKKNWHELALKHALHHAAKHGYHGVVITPGQEQAERYPRRDETEKLAQEAGMKGFYDKIVPDYLNKLGKPHGVKVQMHGRRIKGAPEDYANAVEKMNIAHVPMAQLTPEQNQQIADTADKKLHHFPITEPMRQQILQGQPMYKQGGIIHKAEGGNVQPSLAQMRMALNKRPSSIELQNIGINEAPNMSPKIYMPPAKDESMYPPPGGVATPNGMPIGGVDQNQVQPGQQLMEQQPIQPPQGAEGALPGQPPQGGPQPPVGPTGPTPPMGNMLSMTPQGQTMQALAGQAPKPPGMAIGGGVQSYGKGGSEKSLHFPPSPALMKSEIEAHAERMARQVAGLDNPNQKTIQQLAREQNLPLGITKNAKKQNVPIIDFEKAKGSYSVGVPGDPSRGGVVPATRNMKRHGMDYPRAGETLKSIGGEKLESPVPMYGGKDYGAYGHPEGWASDLGASAGMFNIVKRLHEEDPTREIYGHYHKMSPESLNHAVHMMDAVLSHHRPHQSSAEHIAALNHLMRNVATTTSKSDVRYPEFPGFENPNDVMFHGSLNSGMRKKLINILGTEKYFPGGKQKMNDIIYAMSHPELRNIETGAGGSSILKFDPTRELRDNISRHPTYGHDIPSKLIGRTRYITPSEILSPRSMHNATEEIKAMGKKVLPFNQAKMSIIREPIDEQYINQMGEYENAMKKRLGYKKGGDVKLSPTQDTMRLALTKKKAK